MVGYILRLSVSNDAVVRHQSHQNFIRLYAECPGVITLAITPSVCLALFVSRSNQIQPFTAVNGVQSAAVEVYCEVVTLWLQFNSRL